MHLVYIVRPGKNEELRYSIRSALTNLPVESLTIVGDSPGWVTGARHIPGNRHRSKPMNVLDNIRLTATHPDLPEDVVLMNDDFFILEPLNEIPTLYRGPLADHVASTTHLDWWGQSLQRTHDWLTGQGVLDPLSYELHVPFPMNRALMRDVLDRLGDHHADNPPQWRTIYGNIARIGGMQAADVKLTKPGAVLPKARFVSTTDAGFYLGVHGAVAALFPHRSPFETDAWAGDKENLMTFYKNRSTGQIVENTTGSLDHLARWEKFSVPDAPIGGTPADVVETIPGAENIPPIELIAEAVEDGEPTGEDGIPVLTPAAEIPEEVPVPDETWTDEALDALGKERGITWRSNASKATKVAKLTAPAAE